MASTLCLLIWLNAAAEPHQAAPRANATLKTNPAIARDRAGLWMSSEEIRKLPKSGRAWLRLESVAYADWGRPKLSDQNLNHNTNVLAGALVAVRTGDAKLAERVKSHLRMIPGTEDGGRTLALARKLHAYIVAASLVELNDSNFDQWLRDVRHKTLGGRTLISTHEDRPNNWGTHAGASRIAAAIYLGDDADLEQAARVFAGWLGDRSKYAGFTYGDDLSWQVDPTSPVGVNLLGATKFDRNVDGVIPDDMRRGGPFDVWPPRKTSYPWAALNGVVIQAELLHRQGYDAWNWSDQAIKRAVACLERLGWYAQREDEEWLIHLVNARYGTKFRTRQVTKEGKGFGWTDWTHAVGF